MDMEQLKLILDTVSQVSGDAAAIAISYIVLDAILPFVFGIIVVFCVYKLGSSIVECLAKDNDESFFIEMRDLLRTGVSGHLSAEEKSRTIAKLREIALNHKGKQ